MKFVTTILAFGNNTGIALTPAQLESLGGGKKPLVRVTLNGYTYRSAVATMGGQHLISLSAEHRKAAGVQAGDELEITVELDTEPRTVELPAGLQAAFEAVPAARTTFERLAPSRQKAIVVSIQEAKSEDTRQRRIDKAVADLLAGKA